LENGCVEGIEVEPEVDTGIVEGFHASVVLYEWVDVVGADGVCEGRLHEVDVELALCYIDRRICRGTFVCHAYTSQRVLVMEVETDPSGRTAGRRRRTWNL
jgi:hypothetical protein